MFGAVVVALGVGGVPFAQEIIFVISMAVICTMLVLVTARARSRDAGWASCSPPSSSSPSAPTPTVGDGYFWWTLDELQFRRRVLRHAAPDRRDPVDRRDVDVQPSN